jgi:hypothetical protein
MFDIFYIKTHVECINIFNATEVSTIDEAHAMSNTRFFWIINYLCDYSSFDFLWEPKPWEIHQRHAWSSQWQRDSETYLIPKHGFTDTHYHQDKIVRVPDKTNWVIPDNINIDDFDFSWHPDITEDPYIYQVGTQHQKTGGPRYVVANSNVVKYIGEIKLNYVPVTDNVYLIDHNNANTDVTISQLNKSFDTVTKTRFISSYLGTLSRIMRKIDNGYVWVTSSLCDYSNFDFSWHPEQWESTMLHVFPSNEQKFGDTFLINAKNFNTKIKKTELLEWFNTINFITLCSVPRWDMPVVNIKDDSIVEAVKEYEFREPLVLFTNNKGKCYDLPTINLWRKETRKVFPLSDSKNTTIIPRDAKSYVLSQIYDYPYISKKCIKYRDPPLDIIFVSNGESNAEKNWNHLLNVTKDIPNKVIRVNNVNGRAKSFYTSAKLSNTSWYFAVPAKLKVNPNFNWGWQPDKLQQSKHYIFHAKNPVTGLEYGHMAVVAYNTQLVITNTPSGLDFTLDQAHEVIPLLSGVAYYADSKIVAWRTAFREVIKLKNNIPTVENTYRLKKWISADSTEFGEWSQCGANDAVAYYNKVNGNFSKLQLSYEWDWLNDYFNERH